MTTITEKNREQRLRRALNKRGYSLHKSRRAFNADNLGGYLIANQQNNTLIAGERFNLSLDDVNEWLEYLERE